MIKSDLLSIILVFFLFNIFILHNKFIRITSLGGWIGSFWWVNRDPSNLKGRTVSWIGSFGFDRKPQFILGFK